MGVKVLKFGGSSVADRIQLNKTKEIILSDRNRKAERYMVQVMGQAVVNHRKTINVIVNDISVRGISLLIGKDQSINMGDEINLSFFKAGTMKRINT